LPVSSTSGASISRRTALAGLAAAPLLIAADQVPVSPIVACPAGRFAGARDGGVCVFRGIRFGRAERFRAPVAVPRAADLVQAMEFGPSAPQGSRTGNPTSEDCLFLNIWAPEPAPRANRPVMVYFHGGAYSNGTPVSPLLDGARLAAAGDVVVVTVAHRLNAFGYLYLARLDPRFADSGNAGQLDLILALQWVRDNIAAFGGDPRRVMVFGQSGGGAKIASLMGMPAAAGLFHRAATMSGQQVTVSGPLNATRRTRAYMEGLRTTSVDALLALPTEALVEGLRATDPVLGGGVYFGPVLDMKWLTRHPFWPDANPQSNRIPLMLGNTRDETRGFFGPDHRILQGLDWANLPERLGPELRVDVHPEWVVGEYRRLFPAHTPEQIFFAATTAGRSWRGQIEEAEARARTGSPAFVYQLDFASPVEPWRGAPHTLDIPLVFGTLDAPGSIAGTGPDSRRVSEAMMRAFVNFARRGNPNHPGLPNWPPYALPARRTMIFDATPRVESDPRRAQREIFARVPYIQPGT
jgi:para-nitrobenzyl esterase